MSHPMWVRGLKQYRMNFECRRRLVAPYVGAWIETCINCMLTLTISVAPYVGAWIETDKE